MLEDYSNYSSFMDLMSQLLRWAGLPHEGGACGLSRTCKSLPTLIIQALNLDDMGPEERKVTQAIIPEFVVDGRERGRSPPR